MKLKIAKPKGKVIKGNVLTFRATDELSDKLTALVNQFGSTRQLIIESLIEQAYDSNVVPLRKRK